MDDKGYRPHDILAHEYICFENPWLNGSCQCDEVRSFILFIIGCGRNTVYPCLLVFTVDGPSLWKNLIFPQLGSVISEISQQG